MAGAGCGALGQLVFQNIGQTGCPQNCELGCSCCSLNTINPPKGGPAIESYTSPLKYIFEFPESTLSQGVCLEWVYLRGNPPMCHKELHMVFSRAAFDVVSDVSTCNKNFGRAPGTWLLPRPAVAFEENMRGSQSLHLGVRAQAFS